MSSSRGKKAGTKSNNPALDEIEKQTKALQEEQTALASSSTVPSTQNSVETVPKNDGLPAVTVASGSEVDTTVNPDSSSQVSIDPPALPAVPSDIKEWGEMVMHAFNQQTASLNRQLSAAYHQMSAIKSSHEETVRIMTEEIKRLTEDLYQAKSNLSDVTEALAESMENAERSKKAQDILVSGWTTLKSKVDLLASTQQNPASSSAAPSNSPLNDGYFISAATATVPSSAPSSLSSPVTLPGVSIDVDPFAVPLWTDEKTARNQISAALRNPKLSVTLDLTNDSVHILSEEAAFETFLKQLPTLDSLMPESEKYSIWWRVLHYAWSHSWSGAMFNYVINAKAQALLLLLPPASRNVTEGTQLMDNVLKYLVDKRAFIRWGQAYGETVEGWVVRASTEFVHKNEVSLIDFILKGLWATPLKAFMLVNRKTFNDDVNDFLVDYEGLENRWNRLHYEEKRAWVIETYGAYPKISERLQHAVDKRYGTADKAKSPTTVASSSSSSSHIASHSSAHRDEAHSHRRGRSRSRGPNRSGREQSVHRREHSEGRRDHTENRRDHSGRDHSENRRDYAEPRRESSGHRQRENSDDRSREHSDNRQREYEYRGHHNNGYNNGQHHGGNRNNQNGGNRNFNGGNRNNFNGGNRNQGHGNGNGNGNFQTGAQGGRN